MGLLKMNGITKSFNGVTVLHHVDLTVGKGEVHALLGENGAGKSTLMNVLTGVFPRDGGTVEFDGKEIGAVTIRQSEELGIAFVHQELNLFNDLKVYENIFLGREYKNRIGKLDKKKMVAETRELFEELGVDMDPTEVVANLKTSQKQLLEISKALFFKAKLLILDEPTTSLNNDEVAHLFSIVNSLKRENGTSFIFISHKMPEIFEISDRYTVFRNGHFIGTGNISDTDPESVTRLMVGEGYSAEDVYRQRETGGEALKLEHFSGSGFSDVSLTVKKRAGDWPDRPAGSRQQRADAVHVRQHSPYRRQNAGPWEAASHPLHPQRHESRDCHAGGEPQGKFRPSRHEPFGKHVPVGAYAVCMETADPQARGKREI